MGASLGSPKLVKRNMNWKHGDSFVRSLCSIFNCKMGINYCLVWVPKSRPWEKDLGSGNFIREVIVGNTSVRKERKWDESQGSELPIMVGNEAPLSGCPSQNPLVMHLRIVQACGPWGIHKTLVPLLVKYCLLKVLRPLTAELPFTWAEWATTQKEVNPQAEKLRNMGTWGRKLLAWEISTVPIDDQGWGQGTEWSTNSIQNYLLHRVD